MIHHFIIFVLFKNIPFFLKNIFYFFFVLLFILLLYYTKKKSLQKPFDKFIRPHVESPKILETIISKPRKIGGYRLGVNVEKNNYVNNNNYIM